MRLVSLPVVDGSTGLILHRGGGRVEEALLERFSVDEVVRLREGEFLMPGFVDAHIHAPQFPNAGVHQRSRVAMSKS